MVISGLQKTTLIDYPDHVACTIFTYGCNFRCPFCHNPELVIDPLNEQEIILEEDFFRFLNKRKGMLDGVVITGGEPCLQKDLVPFSQKIKNSGFLVKIDTNGSLPGVIEELLQKKVVDYIAMDVKTDLEGYKDLTGIEDTKSVVRSIKLLKNSKIDYEFRTTVVKKLHTKVNIENIGKLLEGERNFSLQNFKHGKSISSKFDKLNEFSKDELEEFSDILKKYIENVYVKNIY